MANDTPIERMKDRRSNLITPPNDPIDSVYPALLWNNTVLADMLIDLGELVEKLNEQVTDLGRPRPFIGPP